MARSSRPRSQLRSGNDLDGLAKAVEPDELHDIDIEESRSEMARAASAGGQGMRYSRRVSDRSSL